MDMALFNFPPYNASGSTGFLDPQLAYDAQASLLGQQGAAAPQGQGNPSMWSQLGNSGNSWGPMLMALGAGIASNSGEGWGPGIGKGLAAATSVGQSQRNEAIKQQQLQAQLQHQQIMENLGLLNAQTSQANAQTNRERAGQMGDYYKGVEADRQAAQELRRSKWAAPLSLITGSVPQYQTAKNTLLNADFWSRARGAATGTGEFGKALLPVKQMIVGLAQITGQNPKDLNETMLPSSADDAAEKLSNLESALGQLNTTITDQTLAPQLEKLRGLTPTPPSNPATTTSVPMSGAPQQPIQAGSVPGAVVGPNARPIPAPDKLQILRQYANNPDARAAFDEIYGAGAADHFLQGGR